MATDIPRGNVAGLITYQQSINVASVAAATIAEQDFTVTGVKATDVCVSVSKPSLSANLGIVGWRVKAADTISITFQNNHATNAVDPAAETYTFVLARPVNSANQTVIAF